MTPTRVHLHQAFRCCPFAGAVTGQMHEFFVQNGLTLVDDPDAADVHVINTCGSDAAQAELTWATLRRLAPRAGAVRVVVTGCLVSIEPRRLATELAPFGPSASFDPRHMDGLDAVFGPVRARYADVQPTGQTVYRGNDFEAGWHHVVASTGCLGTCRFCAIRRATGRPRSRSIAEVLADVRSGVAAGLRDVLLVSTDLSAWGTDRGESVVDLVAAVTREPGDFVLAGESFEPTLFLEHFDALLPWFATGRWAFVGLPIQSGSTRVLRSMERTYDPEAVVAAVRRLKAAAPDVVVRTDLLYGFGDESDAEFAASIEVSRAFDLPSFNPYQPRPGTPALELAPEVLVARRDRAHAELHRRAQAGVPAIRRGGGRSDVSRSATQPRSAADPGGGAAPRASEREREWIVAEARRLTALVRRTPEWPLAAGWQLVGVRAAEDGVRLGLRHADGRGAEVGLRAPDWPGDVMARGRRYAVWVPGEGAHADPGFAAALRRIVATFSG